MKKLLLIGGGGHCKSCIDVIEQQGGYEIIGIVDNHLLKNQTVLGYPVVGNDQDLDQLTKLASHAIVTVGQIGNANIRKKLYRLLLKFNYQLPVIISSLAYIAKDVIMGKGSVVLHGAIINRASKIGKNCIVNSQALIEHDVVVGDHCHIATKVTVNGGSSIGNGSFLGSNSVIIQETKVEENAFIKANQVYKG